MKIGILTLPLNINYGGILQAYALQTVLRRMGHETTLIDQSVFKHLPIWRAPMHYSKRFFSKYILNRKHIFIFDEHRHNKIYPIISREIQSFIDCNIDRIVVSDFKKQLTGQFDALIVGSDQIWRPIYYPKIRNAYLDFAKNWSIKRISYAASFGADIWEYTEKDTQQCKQLLQKFDAVSVREDIGVSFCRKYLNREAEHLLDPTMLLDKNDYTRLFESKKTPPSIGNLLVYILDMTHEKEAIITILVRKYKYQPFLINNPNTENSYIDTEKRIAPSIEKWLRGFHDAEFVITDSFHACVFAILFNKPFLVYGHKSRGMARFNSLLKLFGLENRLIHSPIELNLEKMHELIDWSLVNQILNQQRKNAFNFLKKNIGSHDSQN